MRIYMQTPPQEDDSLRFCQLLLQQDLLGGWTLVREMGRQGAAGRIRREHFDDRSEAIDALMALREQQVRRGFRVVYAEGAPPR